MNNFIIEQFPTNLFNDDRRTGVASRPTDATRASTIISHLRQSQLFRDYQEAFEATTGLPLVLREAGSLRTPLESSKKINPFCVLMAGANNTCSSCLLMQDQLESEATHETKTGRCYAGLSESAVPVRIGDRILGYLQTGQVFFERPGREQFEAVTFRIGRELSDHERREMETAYDKTRVLSRTRYEAMLRLLAVFAQHLAAASSQILVSAAVSEPRSITQGRTFIAEHCCEQLCLTDVAGAVHMSPHYFCRIFRKSTGLTFTEYLSRERVEIVKRTLLDPHMRVSEAANAAGFQSLSQFNRVFRRIAGGSPCQYRDRLHQGTKRSPATRVKSLSPDRPMPLLLSTGTDFAVKFTVPKIGVVKITSSSDWRRAGAQRKS